MSNNKKYWKSLEDYSNSPEFVKNSANEFAEPIPVDEFLSTEGVKSSQTPRRDFLKFLGFSVTAATLAACEAPVRKVVPYLVKPEEVYPGIANWYASSFFDGVEYSSILVKTREGRPIKIEGNQLSSITQGATSARVQASVLSLYDSSRFTTPMMNGETTSWSALDKEIGLRLNQVALKGGNVRILTSTIISPSTKQLISEFTSQYSNAKHIQYDSLSYSAILNSHKTCFDKQVLPTYRFENANVIVGFAADFLGTWIAPIEFTKGYSKGRKLAKGTKTMSRHYHFESNLSLTGSNADFRTTVKPSQIGFSVLNLYNEVAKLTGGTSVNSKPSDADKTIAKAAKDLVDAKGKSLVICGLNDPNIQCVVNCINAMLGNYGTTLDLDNPTLTAQGIDKDVIDLVADMNSGKVDALFTYNVNPVYTLPASLKFADAMKRVSLKVSFSATKDETVKAGMDFIAPASHYLESWGDANPRTNIYSLQQPTINPIFKTRQFEDSLLVFMGAKTDFYTYLTQNWEKNIFTKQSVESNFTAFWNKSLHDGIFEIPASAVTPATCGENCDIAGKASEILKTTGGDWEATLYAKINMRDGSQAGNPWLQEAPDPISKVTWDNYITMSPIQMTEMGLSIEQGLNKFADKLKITINGVDLTVPVFPQPGQKKNTIGLALGYGRTEAGKISKNLGPIGVNAFSALKVVGDYFQNTDAVTMGGKVVEPHLLATTQSFHTLMGRSIVKETTFNEWVKDPKAGNEQEYLSVKEGHEHLKKTPKELDLWATAENPGFEKPNHFWNMSIDLTSCTGCGTCVVSCQAENNVSVVGKEEISRSRDMQWIRIDRYYSSDMTKARAEEEGKGLIDMYQQMEVPSDEPQVVFQPVMCMHCNHAPCETVCPVIATTHTNEGLNSMTYNRCVGTKYCANNCPYKVRRFNWFKYTDNAMFDFHLNDQLGKMVLNPDVTVRSRGVMEKCSMCVQRIQEGKLKAKKEGRKIMDGEVNTACAQACPANAITFGDINDAKSQISENKKDERMYYLLEELNVQPSVFYMTKVRNVEGDSELKAETKKEDKAEA